MNIHTNQTRINSASSHYQQASLSRSTRAGSSIEVSAALGSPTSSGSKMMNGFVGSVLGNLYSPIPYLGSEIGGLIGPPVAGPFGGQQDLGATSCSETMKHKYGKQNVHSADCYGYPTEYHQLPKNFNYNPSQSQIFPIERLRYDSVGLPINDRKPALTHEVQERFGTTAEVGDRNRSQASVSSSHPAQSIETQGSNTTHQLHLSPLVGRDQVIRTGGDNSGTQSQRVLFGDVAQDSHAQGANVGAQEAVTVLGHGVQNGSGGDGSDFTQNLSARNGVQTFVAGANSRVNQTLEGGGEQRVAIESGEVTQEEDGGPTDQLILGGHGPIVTNQENRSGHMAVVETGAGGIVRQNAESRLLSDDDVSGSVVLGNGPTIYEGEGNGGDNHFLIDGSTQTDSSPDLVRVSTENGDDTVAINTSGGPDRYEVDMGRGNEDRLVVNESNGPVRVDIDGESVYQSEAWTPENSVIDAQDTEQLSVYRPDGGFSRWSEETGLVEGRDAAQPGEMTPLTAARQLREHAGLLDRAAGVDVADGIIGAPDLRAALENPETTPELREAIQYSLDNPAIWSALDSRGAGDNRTTTGALNEFIDSYETRQAPTTGPMNDRRAVEVLNYHSGLLDTAGSGDADGRFNNADLQALLSDENRGLPSDLREAAARFVGSEQLQNDVDAVSMESNLPFASRVFTEDDLSGYVAAS